MRFNPCKERTIGVEWELQLLDPETLDLYDGIMPLMEVFPETEFIKPEFIQSCVELTSDVSSTSEQAVRHIRRTLENTVQRCNELNIGLCASGTHPFGRRLALITPIPRYRHMAKTGGYLASHQITFSTHVHIGMQSGDEAMRVMARLIPVIPALMAISANSPFWRGHKTRHAAYRHRILAAAPNYGLPTGFRDWAAFEQFLAAAARSSAFKTFKDIHWDIRPHPDFGTLEIRVMDAASNLRDLHALASLVRCLVVATCEADDADLDAIAPLNLPHWIETQNRYAAARLGMGAEFIVDSKGNHRPIREFVEDLYSLALSVAASIDESAGMTLVRQMLDEKPPYQRQLDVYEESQSVRVVVERLRDELMRSAREGNKASGQITGLGQVAGGAY